MTAYSSKNEELITFINETLSNIERETKDLECLYHNQEKQGRFVTFQTIEDFLENLKALYSKTADEAEKLSIRVQRKDDLSNPVASLARRSFIQKH
ncbi:hypothetical protein [Wolbachia endosymbiont (group B) of Schoenobius gigantella]